MEDYKETVITIALTWWHFIFTWNKVTVVIVGRLLKLTSLTVPWPLKGVQRVVLGIMMRGSLASYRTVVVSFLRKETSIYVLATELELH